MRLTTSRDMFDKYPNQAMIYCSELVTLKQELENNPDATSTWGYDDEYGYHAHKTIRNDVLIKIADTARLLPSSKGSFFVAFYKDIDNKTAAILKMLGRQCLL